MPEGKIPDGRSVVDEDCACTLAAKTERKMLMVGANFMVVVY